MGDLDIMAMLIYVPFGVACLGAFISAIFLDGTRHGGDLIFGIGIIVFILAFIAVNHGIKEDEYSISPLRVIYNNEYTLTFDVDIEDSSLSGWKIKNQNERVKIRAYYRQKSEEILQEIFQSYEGESEGLEQYVKDNIMGKTFQMNKTATVKFTLKSFDYEPYQAVSATRQTSSSRIEDYEDSSDFSDSEDSGAGSNSVGGAIGGFIGQGSGGSSGFAAGSTIGRLL